MKPGQKSRPLRALAGLAVVMAIWIGVRLPAMQREVAALAALVPTAATPRLVAAQSPAGAAPVQAAPPPVLAAAPNAAKARNGVSSLRLAAFSVLEAAPPAAASARPAAASTQPPARDIPPAAGSITPADPAFRLAAQAYDRLRAGQRRQAAALFDAALALKPDNALWQIDRRALGRRWQVGGYALLREAGIPLNQPGTGLPGFAASPVLGGGQVGASVAFLPDPYARRPLALTVRANVAADVRGVQGEAAQMALGVRQTLLTGISLSIERLVPLGAGMRGAFTARLAAGGRLKQLGQRLEGYGEAGVLSSGQAYAGGQARARFVDLGPATLHAGAWASVQTGSPDVWRVDVGPTASMKFKGIRVEADWRLKVGGNASPGSGPVLTVAAGF